MYVCMYVCAAFVVMGDCKEGKRSRREGGGRRGEGEGGREGGGGEKERKGRTRRGSVCERERENVPSINPSLFCVYRSCSVSPSSF